MSSAEIAEFLPLVTDRAYLTLLLAAEGTCYSAERLARQFGCSLRSLQRDFRLCANCSPKHFLSTLRAVEAMRCLVAGTSPKEVAYRFCYHDPSHFTHAIKKHSGLVPLRLVEAVRGGAGLGAGVSLRENVAFLQGASLALCTKLQHRKVVLIYSRVQAAPTVPAPTASQPLVT